MRIDYLKNIREFFGLWFGLENLLNSEPVQLGQRVDFIFIFKNREMGVGNRT